jgi:hypothetical protein
MNEKDSVPVTSAHGAGLLVKLLKSEGPSVAGRIRQIEKFTSSGLEPATFWLVAQCFNHYVTTCLPVL